MYINRCSVKSSKFVWGCSVFLQKESLTKIIKLNKPEIGRNSQYIRTASNLLKKRCVVKHCHVFNYGLSDGFSAPHFLDAQREGFKTFLTSGLIQELNTHGTFSIRLRDRTEHIVWQDWQTNLRTLEAPLDYCFDIIFHGHAYKLTKPILTPKQAILKHQTYTSQLFVPVQFIYHPTNEIFIDWFLIANLPMMTKNGHFIINGSPRLIMNQIVRRPGIYFKEIPKPNKKSIYVADFIAQRGTWLRLEIDNHKQRSSRSIWAKIKGTEPCPVCFLLNDLFLTPTIFDHHLKSTVKRFSKEPIFQNTFSDRSFEFEQWLNFKGKEKDAQYASRRGFFRSRFGNSESYTLSRSGRANLNQTLGLNLPLTQTLLTGEDVLLGCCQLIEFFNGSNKSSDIDDLKNRKIRSSGELIQDQISLGLIQLRDHIKNKLNQTSDDKKPFWFIQERLNKAKKLNKKKLYIEKKTYFDSLITSAPINKALKDFFGTNPLSQFLDQTNPLAELTHKRRLSSLGDGGVNRETAGMAIRGIHPSHYGRVCPIETPEGQNAGLVNSFTAYAKLNGLGLIETPFYKVHKGIVLKTQKPYLLSAAQEKTYSLAPGDVSTDRFNYLPQEKISVRQATRFKRLAPTQIDFISVDPLQMISVATSLIPFLEHDDGNRALMGSNMQRQAVPTIIPSRPIVGTGFESKVIADSAYGISAKQSGLVTYVDNQKIVVYTENKFHSSKNLSSIENQKLQHIWRSFKTNRINKDIETVDLPLPLTKNLNVSKGHSSHVSLNTKGFKLNRYSDINRYESEEETTEKRLNFGSIYFDEEKPLMFSLTTKQLRNIGLKSTNNELQSLLCIFSFIWQQIPLLNKKEKQVIFNQATLKILDQTRCPMFFKIYCLIFLKILLFKPINSNSKQYEQNQKIFKNSLVSNQYLKNSLIKPQTTTQKNTKKDNIHMSLIPLQKKNKWFKGIVTNAEIQTVTSTWTSNIINANDKTRFDFKTSLFKTHLHKEVRTKQLSMLNHTEMSITKVYRNLFSPIVNTNLYSRALIKNNRLNLNKKNYFHGLSTTCMPQPTHYELGSLFRSNQDTTIGQRATVRPGDWIEKGDLLADNMASCHGELAIGQNLLVGYTPWEGYNFEDAVLMNERVISEDLFTTIHIECYEVTVQDTQYGQEKITAQLPNQSIVPTYLDDDGVIKPGTWVKEGNILVGKVTPLNPKPLSAIQRLLYRIIDHKQPNVRNSSVRVPSNIHGRVIHVEKVKSQQTKAISSNRKSRKNFEETNKTALQPYSSLSRKSRCHFNTAQFSTWLQQEQSICVNAFSLPVFQRQENLINSRFCPLLLRRQEASKSKKKRTNTIKTNSNNLIKFLKSSVLKTNSSLITIKNSNPSILNINYMQPQTDIDRFHLWVQPVVSLSDNLIKQAFQHPFNLNEKGFNSNYSNSVIKVQVYIAEKRKIQVGDKIAGRHGNKGIISAILPRQDMPYLPDGNVLDLVLNPLGVPSRMNVGQIFECLLGFAGTYLNQTYKIQPFDETYGFEASRSLVYSKLYEARLKTNQSWLFNPNNPGKVRLFDGRTGECFEQPVTVGKAYILKLIHLVDEKIHARSTGPYSLVTQQPLRGRSSQGGQRVGEMEVWAFEGFGAAYILQELFTIKSDDIHNRKNVTDAIMGNKPFKFGLPESFNVLMSELQCLCLNVVVGQKKKMPLITRLMPFTNSSLHLSSESNNIINTRKIKAEEKNKTKIKAWPFNRPILKKKKV